MAPDVVVHRQELLHTCMQDLVATNPHASTLPPLLAFLDPAYTTCPMEQDTVPSAATSSAISRAATAATAGGSTGPSGSRPCPGAGLQGTCGSRIRLVTEVPVRLSERELMQRQRGCCAGCGMALPHTYLASAWLGRLHSKVSCMYSCTLPSADAVAAYIKGLLLALELGCSHPA